MEIEVVKHSKDEMDVKLDSITVAEILRVYLNEQGVKFVAWRQEHLTKPAVLKIQSSGKTPKKAISEAVRGIKKDCDKIISELKKKN